MGATSFTSSRWSYCAANLRIFPGYCCMKLLPICYYMKPTARLRWTHLKWSSHTWIRAKISYFSAVPASSINGSIFILSRDGNRRGYINWNRISRVSPDSESRTISFGFTSVSAGGKPPERNSRFFLWRRNSTLSQDRITTSASAALTFHDMYQS